jgi:hypothetical protein
MQRREKGGLLLGRQLSGLSNHVGHTRFHGTFPVAVIGLPLAGDAGVPGLAPSAQEPGRQAKEEPAAVRFCYQAAGSGSLSGWVTPSPGQVWTLQARWPNSHPTLPAVKRTGGNPTGKPQAIVVMSVVRVVPVAVGGAGLVAPRAPAQYTGLGCLPRGQCGTKTRRANSACAGASGWGCGAAIFLVPGRGLGTREPRRTSRLVSARRARYATAAGAAARRSTAERCGRDSHAERGNEGESLAQRGVARPERLSRPGISRPDKTQGGPQPAGRIWRHSPRFPCGPAQWAVRLPAIKVLFWSRSLTR